jgi:hypothetical protein
MAKKNLEVIGKWAFLIGLLLAVIAGLIEEAGLYTVPQLALILVVLGLIVGLLNITEKNVVKLLVAIIALVTVGGAAVAAIPGINAYLTAMLANIIALAGAAGLVVAVKAIYETGKR